MAVMKGADVEQLRRLAGQIEQQSRKLSQIREGLTRPVDQIDWKGADANQFKTDWKQQHSRAIIAASKALELVASILKANAKAQEDTSNEYGVGSGGSFGSLSPLEQDRGFAIPPGAFPGRLQQMPAVPFTGPPPWGGLTPGPLTQPGVTGFVPFAPGSGNWPGAGIPQSGATGSSLVSPIQGFLDLKLPTDQPFFRSFDTKYFVSLLPGGGKAVSAVGLVDIVSDPNKSVGQKVAGVSGIAADEVAGTLRSNPKTYLAGVAISQVKDVITEGSKIDWSKEGTQTTWDYMRKNPGDAAKAAAGAIADYLPKLGSNFLPDFWK